MTAYTQKYGVEPEQIGQQIRRSLENRHHWQRCTGDWHRLAFPHVVNRLGTLHLWVRCHPTLGWQYRSTYRNLLLVEHKVEHLDAYGEPMGFKSWAEAMVDWIDVLMSVLQRVPHTLASRDLVMAGGDDFIWDAFGGRDNALMTMTGIEMEFALEADQTAA